MVFAPRCPVDMGPCPKLCPLQIGPTGNASAEATPPGHLPQGLGLCPHCALRSRYRGGRGKPPRARFPALGRLKCFTHSNTHRLPHAAGTCTQAQIRGHAPGSHTLGRHPRARSPRSAPHHTLTTYGHSQPPGHTRTLTPAAHAGAGTPPSPRPGPASAAAPPGPAFPSAPDRARGCPASGPLRK